MSKELLKIQDLHVSVEEKEILHGVNLTIGQDETHVLMGPNGTGKSTLGYAVTGNPAYSVTSGSIVFDGEESSKPVISSIVMECQVPVNIMFADTRDISGTAYGHMIIQLPEDERQAAKAVAWLEGNRISYREEA